MAVTAAVQQARTHSTLREGVIAGALGATGVAVWFLLVDTIAAEPLFTPVRLGTALGEVLALRPMTVSPAVALVVYTILHYLAFAVVGVVAAAIVHASRAQPTLLVGAFLAFITAQALIYGLVALLHATALLEHLTWVLIAVANLIAAALIGWKLWRDHPGLGRGLDRALAGEDPLA